LGLVTLRRALIWLPISLVLSTGFWLLLRAPIGTAVRAVAMTLARAAGEEPVYPRKDVKRVTGKLPDDIQIGLVVGGITVQGKSGTRTYVMSLMRWHVNLIILPVLAMCIGRATLGQRLVITGSGLAVLLVADGSLTFLYLMLATRRMRDDLVVSASVHDSIEHALAVYATKMLPILVWGLTYLVVTRIGRSASAPDATA
jgi:hypothetical protein